MIAAIIILSVSNAAIWLVLWVFLWRQIIAPRSGGFGHYRFDSEDNSFRHVPSRPLRLRDIPSLISEELFGASAGARD